LFWTLPSAFQLTRIKVECCRDERFVKARRVNPKNFFAELKRRNVYKVAIAYGVVAWLLLQAASILFPTFEAPSWTLKVFVAMTALGFPIALIIAWAFELTPEGLRRTEFADESPTKAPRNRAWIYVIVIAGVISVGLFLLGRYTAPTKLSASANAAAKSIAVLPFENLSEDKANAYFADGIQEEILTRLAKIADLKVISRTSTQRYQSKPGNLSEIAKQLGVANILEGSVQKAGDSVRVSVNLIRADSDSHLWADTYDRKLTDIFGVESEIAKAIADTLQAKLTGSELHAIAARPTENTEAYQLYLKGRFFWNKRTTNDLKKSVDYFNQAIAADPKYALAYVGLADAYVLMPAYGGSAPRDCYPQAKTAAKKALELHDALGEAYTSLARVLCSYDFDFSQGTREFQRAIELNPNYATAHQWYGFDLLCLGRFNEAIAELKRAIELDPLSLVINTDLGNAYIYARRYDEAIEQLRKTLEMDPGFYYAHWNLGSALAAKGDLRAAIGEYQNALALSGDPRLLGLLAYAYGSSGNKAEAMKILDQLTALSRQRFVSVFSFALVYLGLGEKNQALHFLEKSYEDRDVGIALIKIHPFLDPLRGDPRFEALVEKILGATKTHGDAR
jgi:TolB-like protein/Flp pilus assembly protein TadD